MNTSLNNSTIPVNIICGVLGAGKTTAIAKLLAGKPAQESWVVILNEFTDTGIDALTLAAAARGSYDVRMIPGGCLCCTGEEDFRRQLSDLLTRDELPARILIEPSGIGHPGSIIEELKLFERSGAIKLLSTVALIEPLFVRTTDQLPDVARDQIDSADVVLLSKAELADSDVRERFLEWANGLFPSKRFIGFCAEAVIPLQALSPPATPIASVSFGKMRRHTDHEHSHAATLKSRVLMIAETQAVAHEHGYLGREGCGWVIPESVTFELSLIQSAMSQEDSFNDVDRFKAALRTGIDRWHLIQRWNDQFEIREISWRRDSRVELQMKEGITVNWAQWDDVIRSLVQVD